jgi:hypothetical protein
MRSMLISPSRPAAGFAFRSDVNDRESSIAHSPSVHATRYSSRVSSIKHPESSISSSRDQDSQESRIKHRESNREIRTFYLTDNFL